MTTHHLTMDDARTIGDPSTLGWRDRAAHDTLARVSEWADGMPGATNAERLAHIRRLVRGYERDVLGIATAPVDQAEAVSGS